MSWWRRNVLLIALGAFLLLGALSYVLFNVAGSAPERGKGEPVRSVSEPRR